MLSNKLEIAFKNATNMKTFIEAKYDEIASYTMPYFSMWESTKSINKQTDNVNSFILSSVNSNINFLVNGLLTGGEFSTLDLDKSLYERANDIQSKKILKSFDELTQDLEDDQKRVFKILDSSNFTTEVIKSLNEAVNLGTGCVKVIINSSDANPVKFKYFSVKSFCYTEDHEGIDTIFVKYPKMTLRQLRAILKSNVKVTGANTLDDMVTVREVVRKEAEDKYVVELYDLGFNLIKKLQTLTFNPYIIFKTGIFTNNVWGAGLGFQLIDTFKRLNYYNKLQRTSAENQVFPSSTFFGDVNHFSKLDFRPGRHSYGGATKDSFDIVFNPATGNYTSLTEEIAKAENEIAKAYNANPIGEFNDRGVVTAREITARLNLFRQSNSITYELLSEQLLKAVFFSIYNVMIAKKLNKFDQSLIEMTNIRYTNALSKSKDLEKANQLISYKTTMLQTAPQTELVQIDQLKYGEELGKLMDIPYEVFKTSDEAQAQVQQVQDAYVENPQNITPQQTPPNQPEQQEDVI